MQCGPGSDFMKGLLVGGNLIGFLYALMVGVVWAVMVHLLLLAYLGLKIWHPLHPP